MNIKAIKNYLWLIFTVNILELIFFAVDDALSPFAVASLISLGYIYWEMRK